MDPARPGAGVHFRGIVGCDTGLIFYSRVIVRQFNLSYLAKVVFLGAPLDDIMTDSS
ncbi:hypothetical protein DSUL_20232 [Desulfovibrionales bacterium]